jgi:hypothetical protein
MRVPVWRFQAIDWCPHRWLPSHVCRSLLNDTRYLTTQRTVQTAVLIETLTALGAEVTWSSCVSVVLDYDRDSLLIFSSEHLLYSGSCCCCVSATQTSPTSHNLNLPPVSLRPVFPCSPGRVKQKRNTSGALSKPLMPSLAASL